MTITTALQASAAIKAGAVGRTMACPSLLKVFLPIGAVATDAAAIGSALLAVTAWLPEGAPAGPLVIAGAGCGLLHLGIGLIRRDYAVDALRLARQPWRALVAWAVAAAAMMAASVAALAPSAPFLIPFFAFLVLGVVVLPALRIGVVHLARASGGAGRPVHRRLMVVGEAGAAAAFLEGARIQGVRYDVVAAVSVRTEPGTMADDLALAVATARLRRPDDVLLLPGADAGLLRDAMERFRSVPAALHLGAPRGARRADRDGSLALEAVRLADVPVSTLGQAAKRGLDVALAGAALVALSPLMGAVALAIKLDSPGPVFFRQRRVGYNQRAFRIVKFRSMSTLDDGRAVQQATVGDRRITRVGAWLRRTSIDELPQLLNVLAGDMSLVGPRPHALAHDQAFAQAHAPYARRHVVRPGITGWAQVNGFRGETDTPEKIEGRVRHDLAYVDNWSLWLDLRILARTALSPRTFTNAR